MADWIAFDLDGTLVSCAPRQKQALRHVSGLSTQRIEETWHMKRDGLNTRDALVATGTGPAEADRIAAGWGRIIETPSLLSIDTVLDGAEQALRRCRRSAYNVAIITARQSGWLLNAQMKALHLLPLCDKLIRVSPKNASIEKGEHLARMAPIVFLGDTESDAEAARRAGVGFIGLSGGQRSEDFLFRNGIAPLFPDVLSAIEHVLAQVDT